MSPETGAATGFAAAAALGAAAGELTGLTAAAADGEAAAGGGETAGLGALVGAAAVVGGAAGEVVAGVLGPAQATTSSKPTSGASSCLTNAGMRALSQRKV